MMMMVKMMISLERCLLAHGMHWTIPTSAQVLSILMNSVNSLLIQSIKGIVFLMWLGLLIPCPEPFSQVFRYIKHAYIYLYVSV